MDKILSKFWSKFHHLQPSFQLQHGATFGFFCHQTWRVALQSAWSASILLHHTMTMTVPAYDSVSLSLPNGQVPLTKLIGIWSQIPNEMQKITQNQWKHVSLQTLRLFSHGSVPKTCFKNLLRHALFAHATRPYIQLGTLTALRYQ